MDQSKTFTSSQVEKLRHRPISVKSVNLPAPRSKSRARDSQEYEHVKFIRSLIEKRITQQENLLGRIEEGKFHIRSEIPKNVLRALARHDLKVLESSRSDYNAKTSELRHRMHDRILVDCRSNAVDAAWSK